MKLNIFLGMVGILISVNTQADELSDHLLRFRDRQDTLITIAALPEEKLHLKGFYQSAFTKMEMTLDLPKLFPVSQEKERLVFTKLVEQIADCMNKGQSFKVIEIERNVTRNFVRCSALSNNLYKTLVEARNDDSKVGKNVFKHLLWDSQPNGVELFRGRPYGTSWIYLRTPVLNNVGIQAVRCKARVGFDEDDGCDITYLPVTQSQTKDAGTAHGENLPSQSAQ